MIRQRKENFDLLFFPDHLIVLGFITRDHFRPPAPAICGFWRVSEIRYGPDDHYWFSSHDVVVEHVRYDITPERWEAIVANPDPFILEESL